MKNIRWIILFSVLSLFSGVLPAGLSAFKPQKYTTECVWFARKESVSGSTSYRWVQISQAKSSNPGVLAANRHIALLQYTQLIRVWFIHQQARFKQVKTGVLLAMLFIPSAKKTCRPAFG